MRSRGGWLGLALAGAVGFLVGVLLVAALGGAKGVTTTVTQDARIPTSTQGGTIVVRTVVPALIGARLDVARNRLAQARFEPDVNGGGLFGVINDHNWQVVHQDPPAGTVLEQGSTVSVDIERG